MINVCKRCFRINPLDNEFCAYCQKDCQQIEPIAFGQFRLDCLKILAALNQQYEQELLDYPDLKVFTDCAKVSDPWEIIFARP